MPGFSFSKSAKVICCRLRMALSDQQPRRLSILVHWRFLKRRSISRHGRPVWRRHSRNSLKSCRSFSTSRRGGAFVFFEASPEPDPLVVFDARTDATLGFAEALGCSRRTLGGSTCSSVTRPEDRSHSPNARKSAGRDEQLTVVRRTIGMSTVAR
jgi:hypothetical protein